MNEKNYPNAGMGGAGPMVMAPNQVDCDKEDRMTLKNHKRLTDLAYRVKDFIDRNGGLNYQESCTFGQIIQNIINLK